jgi:hypothetical protein
MPTPDRRSAIQAAVEGYNRASPEQRLPRNAARLLLAMFPAENAFCGTQELLRSAGFGSKVSAVLQAIVAAGLLERRRDNGRGPDTYRLVLP